MLSGLIQRQRSTKIAVFAVINALKTYVSCDAIITMLPDGKTVAKVATSLANAGFRGLFIDMSSSHPHGTIASLKTR